MPSTAQTGGLLSSPPGRRPEPQARPRPPGDGLRSGRWFLRILFWLAFGISVELWWSNTPAHSLNGTAAVLIAAGRITGMIGGFIVLIQLLLMSRVSWLERWIGARELLLWHRELGSFLLVVVLAHGFLMIFGYAAREGSSAGQETWTMLTTYENMISAFLATGLLVAISLLSIRWLRRIMPYEVWYYIHATSYLVLVLSYGHEVANGQELMNGGFSYWYWVGLHVLVLGCLAWGRVLGPLIFNLRHQLRVVDVVPETAGMVSIYIGGRRLETVTARAGQYFRWRFLTRGHWWQAHPFSLSAAPNRHWLRLTVKVAGDHTADLQYLVPGVRVFAEGPSGMFTAARQVRLRALLIAGGSGITPIRALLEELPDGATVIYRASSTDDLVFRKELDWLAHERAATVWYVLGGRDEPGPRSVFSPRGLRELVPDVRRRDVYLCGPRGLVSASLKVLGQLRIPRRQIHTDLFEL